MQFYVASYPNKVNKTLQDDKCLKLKMELKGWKIINFRKSFLKIWDL